MSVLHFLIKIIYRDPRSFPTFHLLLLELLRIANLSFCYTLKWYTSAINDDVYHVLGSFSADNMSAVH